MKEKMRRLLAMVLVLVLVGGQMVLPALATEVPPEAPVNPEVTVVVKPVEGGTQTTTTTTDHDTGATTTTVETKTEPQPGTTVTQTNTTATDGKGGTSTSKGTVTQTQDTYDIFAGTQTDTTTTWEETTVDTTPIPGGSSTTTTVVEGSEDRTDKEYTEVGTENFVEEGWLSGEETTYVTTVDDTTKTEKDQLIGEATIVDADINVPDETTSEANDLEESWLPGKELGEEEGWKPAGKIESGEEPDPEDGKITNQTKPEDVTPDDPGAKLELTPNGKWETEEIKVTLEQVARGEFSAKFIQEIKKGKHPEYSIEETKDGWIITKRTEKKPVKTDDTTDVTITESWHEVENSRTESVGTDADLQAEMTNHPEGQTTTNPDGSTVKRTVRPITDDQGNFLGYEIETITITKTDAETKQESDRSDEVSTGTLAEANGYLMPTKPNVGDLESDGDVITDVQELKDAEGNLIGYTVTTEKKDENGNLLSTEERELLGTPVTPPTEENSGFVLPERPGESETVDEYGTTTKVTVTDLVEDGKHVGYTIHTKITDRNESFIRTETRNIYGTWSSTQVEVTKDPTREEVTTHTTVTDTVIEKVYVTDHTREMEQEESRTQYYDTTILTEEDLYQFVETAGGTYFIYKGVMYPVVDDSEMGVTERIVATEGSVILSGHEDIRYGSGLTGTVSTNINPNNPEFSYGGYGMVSAFKATDSTGDEHTLRQYITKKGNDVRYVYCVEMGAEIYGKTVYSDRVIDKDDTVGNSAKAWNNPDNYDVDGASQGTVQQLRSVAANGFWGTANGLGSLDAVKELMRRNGLDKEADKLTVGMALAATQLAIWEFGAPQGAEYEGNYITKDYSAANNQISNADFHVIDTLRTLLIDLANSGSNGHVEAITADDIKSGSITVKEQITNSDGTAVTDAKGNNQYKADISFKMEVSTSSLNGDLVLKITDANGNNLGNYRLAGEDGDNLIDATIGLVTNRIRPDSQGNYTIKDLELFENVKINLNLVGIQHLDDGIYLYQGQTDSQDFIGLSTVNNEVDLTVSMEFNVEDPSVMHTHTDKEYHRQDGQLEKRTNKRTDTARVTKLDTSGNELTQRVHEVDVYGDITVNQTETSKTKENRHWESYWRFVTPKEKKNRDEGVALAAAPKTGDLSGIWAAVSALSLSGVALLSRKRKEDE